MQGTIALTFLTSLVIVILATPALIKVSYLKRLVDEPGEERKLHKRRVPTIGGIMIFAATLFSYLMWYPLDTKLDILKLEAAFRDFKYIGASMIILFFVGVKDDIIGTAPLKKLVGHLIVAFILVIMGDIKITSMHGLLGLEGLNEWASIFLSVFTYTVIVNAFNLIDGVDGLAAGVGSIVCLACGIWFFYAGGIQHSILAFALAGSLIGFLVFNFNPAKIFMGDSGSLTIGLIVSVLCIKLIEFDHQNLPGNFSNISTPVFAMAVLSYPLMDTLRIFIYRAARGVSPFSADRNHMHHILLDAGGFNHKQTVMCIYAYNLFMIFCAAFLVPDDPTLAFGLILVIAVVATQIPIFFLKRKAKKRALR
ncbi:MAG: glycosyltransferase family 4 protein [Salibacteraceae bacterium]